MRRGDFDSQADIFDERAGIGDRVAEQVADAVARVSGVGRNDVLLDIGAGTGEIGRRLTRICGGYIAIDESLPMLTARAWSSNTRRVVANCDDGWPIADASVDCVFAARVAHLLDASHLVDELRRVARGDLCVILGRARRADDGLKELLRGRMRQSLRDRGIGPREGRLKTKRLIETMTAAGARVTGPIDVADWTTRETPRRVLEAWRRKRGLGGATLDATTRDAVLDEVEEWADRQFGDLNAAFESHEVYTLTEVRMNHDE